MSKLLKYFLLAGAGMAVLGVLLLTVKIITDNKYRRQIPPLPDMQILAAPLKKQISDARDIADHNPTARNLGRLGMVFHSSTYYDQAALCYKLAIKKNRSKWVWNYYLGYLNKEMGDNAGVVENFKKVIEKNPGNNMAWFYIGEGYQAMGKNDKAEEVYKRIISADLHNRVTGTSSRKDYFPLKSYARFQLASIYINTQRVDLAETTLKELIEDQRTFGQAYRLLGTVYSIRGDQELSRNYITRAGDLMIYTPPVDTIVDMLARNSRSGLYLLKQIDDAEKGGYSRFAIELINNAMADIPEDKFVISKAIKIYLLMDLGKVAMPYFGRHLEYFSSDIIELKTVADLCLKKGLYDQAITYYSQAARLQPDDIDVHLSVVLCLGNKGAKQQAVDSVNYLLRKYRNNKKVMTDGTYVMLMLGEKEKAASILADLKKLFPADPKALQLSGIILLQEGKEEQALQMFESSFMANPKDLSSTRYLTDLLIKKEMWEKAISCFRIALNNNPNDPYLLESLGSLLIFCKDEKLRKISEGREFSERAFINKYSLTPTIISAGISLSEAYILLGDKKDAISTMNATIEVAKRDKAPVDLIQKLGKKLQEYSG
jgi:tetratricopeptide (TPR) repeat protein